MESADSPNVEAANLLTILNKLAGSQLIGIEQNQSGTICQLVWQVPAKINKLWPSSIIRVVITSHTHLFYQSYTETVAIRKPVKEQEIILAKNLVLQGATFANSYILTLYTNSTNQVEAGELHLTFTGFQLYDEHYGRIDLELLLLGSN